MHVRALIGATATGETVQQHCHAPQPCSVCEESPAPLLGRLRFICTG
jgi:hypothetical protein